MELTARELGDVVRAAARGGWCTRFAPAPTGRLHLGHAVNALFVWGLARAAGGRVLLRIEDHDRTRCRPEYERGILDDLDWLGLVPDTGGAASQLWRQSDRGARYAAALATVPGVFACNCSRRDIAAVSEDVFGAESRYPGTCRLARVDPASTPARRVAMADGDERFEDLALGLCVQHPASQCGDLLVRGRNGDWTYQFAVVVDDMDQQIDVVIRGADLLESTGRQIRLARLLGRDLSPRFLHHPLVRHPDGSKLSKSDGATGVRELRASGWSAERVLGEAAFLAGLRARRGTMGVSEVAELFG